jgi:threonyl-tRNA synthetase
MITLTLPDGNTKTLPAGSNAHDLALAISPRLAEQAMACTVDGELFDLKRPLPDGATVAILTPKSPQSVEVLRHSTAHIVAQAVQNLFPQAKIAIGPTIDNGFYYDFDIAGHALTPDDLVAIEAEFARIVATKQRFERRNITNVDDQLAQFNAQGEVYKAELLDSFRDNDPTVYYCVDPNSQTDVWHDLCRGPHLPDTSWMVPAGLKLLSVAGAYWRGDEKKAQLQRIYAVAFWTKKELDAHLKQREEAEKRDHRKLGKALDLFSIEDAVGSGLVLWHPNLAVVREELENYWRKEHRRRGYKTVYTPHLAKRDLWDISGHTQFYMDNMFSLNIEEQEFILKPMNCPMHALIYRGNLHSYRDLPLRLAELGTVYRNEKSGTMHGLNRVRGFTQDDAHLFCRVDQIEDEIKQVIAFVDDALKLFGMSFEVELSTRPDKFVGDIAVWDQAETALQDAMNSYGLVFEVNAGDGAFYGPKIDFKLKDAIGRTWQCATVQLDFNLPERFDLKYTDKDGTFKRPIMIHRVIFGSMERFAGTLIEHYAGAFPTWLAPEQVKILPITDRQLERAEELRKHFLANDIRVSVDTANEGIGYKIRQAQLAKVPYMLIIGDKELEAGTVAVRARAAGDLGAMPAEAFLIALQTEIKTHGQTVVSVG